MRQALGVDYGGKIAFRIEGGQFTVVNPEREHNDPARTEYRQGNTLGNKYRHWFRAKFFGRFRLFIRYDSRSRLIVYVLVNDDGTLRHRGGGHDHYEVFRHMLKAGNPANDWAELVSSAKPSLSGIVSTMNDPNRRR